MSGSLAYAVGPIVIVGGLLFLLWQGSRLGRDGAMAEVSCGDDAVEIVPRWPLQLLAFRSRIAIPYEKLVDVTVEPYARDFHRLTLRLAGISVGSLTAGTFRGDDGDSFWLYGAGTNALTLEAREFRYQLVVIEVPDPGAVARGIRAELHARRQ